MFLSKELLRKLFELKRGFFTLLKFKKFFFFLVFAQLLKMLERKRQLKL